MVGLGLGEAVLTLRSSSGKATIVSLPTSWFACLLGVVGIMASTVPVEVEVKKRPIVSPGCGVPSVMPSSHHLAFQLWHHCHHCTLHYPQERFKGMVMLEV
jgi:hypothetical protein